MLLAKCSKVLNPVQRETGAADLPSITGSEEKENIYSQTDKIDLTFIDVTQGKAQG